ncbi:uncharacterized protein LOC132705798 isoform X2 [Cylas formicarius]|uniref:uncharacterized protein LOC132705798 isoform X2 n=1 Tax=Cylas formicarius TaxID=197179 RepID=UPI00295864A3|nr:uncharacterized protein LOC132705798 isoform X2 [Cylas formicarius]
MGKSRTRKTRWRALDIADADRSDSEESNTNSSAISSRFNGSYHQTSARYYGRYSYSSQSTPRRKYQYDSSTKSTRSSSTTSETKITFNDDEYTRITTPRQDVLFKKGYLNKPKAYQTQTSTGNSTVSTGNSTENGTPDHQSADLDYESQFVFPNGFVDQNGIYYVNSYDYPLMLFNPPTYYHEFLDSKAKRYSTGSLTESTSPNNEEATSQDLSQSGGETSNNVSDYAGQPLFNIVYPGYYVEGPAGPPNDLTKNSPAPQPSEPVAKKLKKRRERNTSKTIVADECSSDNSDERSSDEVTSKDKTEETTTPPKTDENIAKTEDEEPPQQKYCLKPDAEEFVPRSYRQGFRAPPQPPAAILPANFVPVPIVPLNEYGAPAAAAAFIPPGIPINFLPHPGQKMFHPAPFFPPPPSPQSPPHEAKNEEPRQNDGQDKHINVIDIETIVSKLEEAAKEQEEEADGVPKSTNKTPSNLNHRSPFKRNHYNGRYRRGSPMRNGDLQEPVPAKPPATRAQRSWVPNGYHNQKHQNGFASPKRNAPAGKNYSEMLKKSPPNVGKQRTTATATEKTPVKSASNSISHAPNQWISVSSRKKKKGKNSEEPSMPQDDEGSRDDGFEAYDVTLLEDVVPSKAEEPERKEENERNQIDEILMTLAQKIASSTNAEVAMMEVSDIEKHMLVKMEPEPPREREVETNEIPASSEEEEARIKKKSKRPAQKTAIKKVIITDVDFSDAVKPQVKTVKPQVTPPEKPAQPEEQIAVEPRTEEPAVTEKRSKKKKKSKMPKPETKDVPTKSEEASYDFLMEESLLDESSDKTNLEVSLELDKLIRKGMYSNLKERIESCNIDAAEDTFFRTLRTTTTDKRPTKTPDFNRIFQSTRQFLKPNSVSVEERHGAGRGDDINETVDPDVADSASGSFLEGNLETEEPSTINDIDDDKTTKDEDSKKLYPITEAVKEWMSKTREATPEVELLKSPSTIIKEFGLGDDPLESQTNSSDEEITLFSSDEASRKNSDLQQQQDLLEFWEDDIPDQHVGCDDNKCCEKCSKSEIRHGDEVLEVYESKYGRGEAYLNLQTRTKDEQGKNSPYRAVCCSLQ